MIKIATYGHRVEPFPPHCPPTPVELTPTWPPSWPPGPACPRHSRPASWRWWGQPPGDLFGLVGASVINDQQLEVGERLHQHGLYRAAETPTSVVSGDDDGDEGLSHCMRQSMRPVPDQCPNDVRSS